MRRACWVTRLQNCDLASCITQESEMLPPNHGEYVLKVQLKAYSTQNHCVCGRRMFTKPVIPRLLKLYCLPPTPDEKTFSIQAGYTINPEANSLNVGPIDGHCDCVFSLLLVAFGKSTLFGCFLRRFLQLQG